MASLRPLPSSVAGYFQLPFSDYVNARVLAANTAETIAIPTGAKYVLFSADGDFYVRSNDTATIPAADVADGTAAILNPTLRSLETVTSLSVIASAARIVTAAFYL